MDATRLEEELKEMEEALASGLYLKPAVAEVSFSCQTCKKEFGKNKVNYERHVEKCKKEKERKEKRFVCAKCGRDFGNNENNHNVHAKKCF
jgi:DNA-directed RNA polymerase subunit RPC12/RpoP